MTRNMGSFDRGLRAFVVAPAAIVVELILGAGTVVRIILFVVAGIMLASAGRGSARRTRSSGSPPTRADCIASAIACAAATPSRAASFKRGVRDAA